MPTIHIPGIDNGDSNDGQVHPPVPALYMDLSLNLQIVLTYDRSDCADQPKAHTS